jgi:hypothetical protein
VLEFFYSILQLGKIILLSYVATPWTKISTSDASFSCDKYYCRLYETEKLAMPHIATISRHILSSLREL